MTPKHSAHRQTIPQFSLAHLTVLGCSAVEMIHMAARIGYDFVSLRLIPMGLPEEKACLPVNRETYRKIRSALSDTGMKILDVELARIVPEVDPKTYAPVLEAAAELGARHVISSAWSTEPMERDFMVERYGEICDLAQPFGLTVELEFPTFSRLTRLKEAREIVERANRSNSGILIDTLYFHFSKVGLEELEGLPKKWLHFLHLCDTAEEIPDTREKMIHIARDNRLYPGEGCIDFRKILDRLPPIPLSIELPNARRVRELGYEGHAARCLETAKAYFSTH